MAVETVEKPVDASHVEEGLPVAEKLTGAVLTEYAKEGNENEHELTVMQAIKMYPMALFWALAVSGCVIMEGYDTILIGNFYAYPAFA